VKVSQENWQLRQLIFGVQWTQVEQKQKKKRESKRVREKRKMESNKNCAFKGRDTYIRRNVHVQDRKNEIVKL
jgi:hypothetical protein